LAAFAAVAAAGLRLTLPRARLALWQALLAVCLILPFVQPWLPAPGGSISLDALEPAPARAPLGCVGLGFVRLARLRRGAAPLDHVPASIDRAIGLSGASATFALSAAVDGPVTFGLRRPVVLLPRGFLDLAPDFQTTVVCHELAHVRRRDWA